MTYEIIDVMPTQIKVSLTFARPLLVSQADLLDQVIVKVNKDVFLVPERIKRQNLGKAPDETPHYILIEDLPQLQKSAEES